MQREGAQGAPEASGGLGSVEEEPRRRTVRTTHDVVAPKEEDVGGTSCERYDVKAALRSYGN